MQFNKLCFVVSDISIIVLLLRLVTGDLRGRGTILGVGGSKQCNAVTCSVVPYIALQCIDGSVAW